MSTLTINESQQLAQCEAVIERGLDTFYEVGGALLKIRDARLYRATHATFEDYCRDRWNVSRFYAHRLIESATVVSNLLPIGNMPKTESQARELAVLETPEQQREAWTLALETAPQGKVTAEHVRTVVSSLNQPQLSLVKNLAREIRAQEAEERREERVQRIAEQAAADPLSGLGRFPVIYADPPWAYEFCSDAADEIENHYPTMTLEEICALPVGEIATPDAVLFCWATSPKLEEALRVVNAWGFNYRSSAVWDKEWIGMGYYYRQQHELLLVATRGAMPVPAPPTRPASVYRERRAEHSRKPGMFYEQIEAMYPTLPKVELFARCVRPGWSAWGNEVTQAKAA